QGGGERRDHLQRGGRQGQRRGAGAGQPHQEAARRELADQRLVLGAAGLDGGAPGLAAARGGERGEQAGGRGAGLGQARGEAHHRLPGGVGGLHPPVGRGDGGGFGQRIDQPLGVELG